MNKWIFTGIILCLIGAVIFCGVMTFNGWNFNKLSTQKYETETHKITDKFSDIKIECDTADIEILKSEDDTCSVVCFENEKEKHSPYVHNGTLYVTPTSDKKWYDNIGVNFYSSKITIYLPKKEYGSLNIKLSTGDVFIEDLNCKNIISRGNTGDVKLINTIATDDLYIKTSTGDVNLERSDSAKIYIKTSAGDVTGTVLEDRHFDVITNTGDVRVPKKGNGGNCQIITNTGDIIIDISK